MFPNLTLEALSKAMEPPPSPERPGSNLPELYRKLLDSGNFKNRAALARHLKVSRAHVTQVLRRLKAH